MESRCSRTFHRLTSSHRSSSSLLPFSSSPPISHPSSLNLSLSFIHPSSILHPSFIHPSYILHLSLIHFSFILPPSFIHPSFVFLSIFHLSFIHLPSIPHPTFIHFSSVFHPSFIHFSPCLPSILHSFFIHFLSSSFFTSFLTNEWLFRVVSIHSNVNQLTLKLLTNSLHNVTSRQGDTPVTSHTSTLRQHDMTQR